MIWRCWRFFLIAALTSATSPKSLAPLAAPTHASPRPPPARATTHAANAAQLRIYQQFVAEKNSQKNAAGDPSKAVVPTQQEQNFPADYYEPVEYYDEIAAFRGRMPSPQPIVTSRTNPRPTTGGALFDRESIDTMLNYIREIVSCGVGGWCGYECCSSTSQGRRRWLPPSGRYAIARENNIRRRNYRHPAKAARSNPATDAAARCPAVCMPHCDYQCMISAAAAESFGVARVPARLVTPQGMPVCRPGCMPLCLDNCIQEPPVTCRPACMPRCTPACVASPPLMVPCESLLGCFCPPGYVQCAETTCCMRYRTMAVRYRDRLPGYLYQDTNINTTIFNRTGSDNQTAVYLTTLRKMAGEIIHELHKNGTVFFDPEKKRVEIVYDDGEVVLSQENFFPLDGGNESQTSTNAIASEETDKQLITVVPDNSNVTSAVS